ncbi:DUF4251 domain-containing protein [Mesonia aquimarina]|uniref:DUF4251 domain-containing protein n=1 Tax=Mesonia aquimarina TaxID=1504967 RepID=UPI001968F329|nr:DUF4251 domain-containing protein [Mesonia aquimarina]
MINTLREFRFSYFLVTLMFLSCGVQQNETNKSENYKELQKIVRSGSFKIENEWAYTQRGNNINLVGNPNYIEFKNDSVFMYLPYFGVRQIGGNYGGTGDGAINFTGKPQKLQIKEIPTKNRIELTFECRNKTETYQLYINLDGSLKANTNINSSKLESISYRGDIINNQ